MSGQFARLYERNGTQVLVTKEEGDNGEPAVQFRFKSASGNDIKAKITFQEGAWDALDEGFENVTEEMAFVMRDDCPGVST